MNAKELMIGDWVNHLNNPQRIKGAVDFTFAKDFEPIPLTAEILEKNGFVKVKREWSSYWYLDFDETIHIEITDKKILNVWMDYDGNDYDQYSDYCMPVPEYVHELQHALRLCGLTELADNFKIE